LRHITNNGWEAEGFEPGAEGYKACLDLGLTVTNMPTQIPEKKYTVITLHHVFEHLTNPSEILENLKNHLADDGVLYIEVPNARSLRARMSLPFITQNFAVDERFRAFPIHLIYYHTAGLKAMLMNAGWTIESVLTLGMGVDEYFLRDQKHKNRGNGTPDQNKREDIGKSNPSKSLSNSKPLRHKVRDLFLKVGLGENLAIIASVKQSSCAEE